MPHETTHWNASNKRPPASYPNRWTECSLLLEGNGRSDQNAAKETRETAEAGGRPGEEGEDEEGLPGDDAGEEGESGAQRDQGVPQPRRQRHLLSRRPGLRPPAGVKAIFGNRERSVSAVPIEAQTFLSRTDFMHSRKIIIQFLGFGLLLPKFA